MLIFLRGLPPYHLTTLALAVGNRPSPSGKMKMADNPDNVNSDNTQEVARQCQDHALCYHRSALILASALGNACTSEGAYSTGATARLYAAHYPRQCPYCEGGILHRHGEVSKCFKDIPMSDVIAMHYRCVGCGRSFTHYPQGVDHNG